ncbi:MAG TPA: PilZ domain-containing protein [Methylococcus sp.]|nr:PilZ domain-containing protein [Methylococcus sp.]
MTEHPQDSQRPGVLSLTIQDKNALFATYMPFVKNGGIFIPTAASYRLGDEVLLLLHLLDETERLSVRGRVIWITPKGAAGFRCAGIGVQFSEQDGGSVRKRIESHLEGLLDSDRPTHTL